VTWRTCFVALAHVLGRAAGDRDVLAREPRLFAERAAGTTLAGETMADRDAHRFVSNVRGELAAAA